MIATSTSSRNGSRSVAAWRERVVKKPAKVAGDLPVLLVAVGAQALVPLLAVLRPQTPRRRSRAALTALVVSVMFPLRFQPALAGRFSHVAINESIVTVWTGRLSSSTISYSRPSSV